MSYTFRSLALGMAIAAAALSLGQPHHAKVSAMQARKAALTKYHGKVVGKIQLENEDGKWQYSVNVRSGKVLREVMVDSNTGKIASVEVTSAKEEAAEARAESHKAHKKPAKAAKHKAG